MPSHLEEPLAKTYQTSQGEILFSVESIVTILAENGDLVRLHVRELSETLSYQVSLNHERYYQLEAIGAMRTFGARVLGQLVGYATFYLNENPQTDGEIHAVQNSLYLHPEWRRGRAAVEFMEFCHERLESAGACAIYHTLPIKAPTRHGKFRSYAPVLERMGFKEIERVYVRRSSWEK